MSVDSSLKNLPEWNRLVELVRELAFLDGGSNDAFTLASGRKSRWFFDMKPVMMHTESTKLLSHLFNHRLDALNPDFVGGLELGAVPLTAIVIGAESITERIHGRKSPKGRGGRKTNNPPGIGVHQLQQVAVLSSLKMSQQQVVRPFKPSNAFVKQHRATS